MDARLAKVFVIAVSIVAVTVGVYAIGIRTIGICANDVCNGVSPFWQPLRNKVSKQNSSSNNSQNPLLQYKNIEFVHKNLPMKSNAICGNLADILKRGELVVCALKKSFVAFCQMPTQDGYIGEDIRFAAALGNALGVKTVYKMVYDTYDEVVDAIYNGEGDVGVANLSYTPNRAQKVTFSSPYIIQSQMLLINRKAMMNKNARNLAEILNIPSAKIAILKNSSYEIFVKGIFPNAQILGNPSLENGSIKQLQQNEVVAVLDEDLPIGILLRSQPTLLLRFLPVILREHKDPISAITSTKEYSLNSFINKFLENEYKVLTVNEILNIYRDYVK